MVERKLIYEVKEYTVLRIGIKALMVQFFFDRCIQCTSVNRKAPLITHRIHRSTADRLEFTTASSERVKDCRRRKRALNAANLTIVTHSSLCGVFD